MWLLIDLLLETGIGADDVAGAAAQPVLIIILDLILIDELDVHTGHQIRAHAAHVAVQLLLLSLALLQVHADRSWLLELLLLLLILLSFGSPLLHDGGGALHRRWVSDA